MTSQTRQIDVFISHASEDKPYVEPLVIELENAGVSVWYDRLVLEWGDDLRPRIDEGLRNCQFGIVVLSKSFLGKKKWTEHELNGLFAREDAGRKLILPIWHGISRKDLLQYSPSLADRLAKISTNNSYANIVESLLAMLGKSGGTRTSSATKSEAAAIPQRLAVIQMKVPRITRVRSDAYRYDKRHFELFLDKTSRLTIDAGLEEEVRLISIPVGEHSISISYDEALPRMDNNTMNYHFKFIKGWVAKGSTDVLLYNFEDKSYLVTLEPIPGKRDSVWQFVTGNGPEEVGSYRFDIAARPLS